MRLVLAALLLNTTSIYGMENLAPAGGLEPGHKIQSVWEYEDECGMGLMGESIAWKSISGTAIDVTGGQTFIMHTSGGRRISIDLVALDASDNESTARKLLADIVQGQFVTVLVNRGVYDNERVSGVVMVGTRDGSGGEAATRAAGAPAARPTSGENVQDIGSGAARAHGCRLH